jgi:parallel beta-helix repeat protein
LFYSNENTVENNEINDSLEGFWVDYSNYNIFNNNTVNRTFCSLFLWHSNYNYFQNNVLPCITIEQYSNHNTFIRNDFHPSRPFNFGVQLESSDCNVFKCNNIYGRNFITGLFTKENKSVQLWDSHFTIWDGNYWGDCFRDNNKHFTKYFPKVIVGFHRGIYVPIPKINFPSIINFDWHPADEPYVI